MERIPSELPRRLGFCPNLWMVPRLSLYRQERRVDQQLPHHPLPFSPTGYSAPKRTLLTSILVEWSAPFDFRFIHASGKDANAEANRRLIRVYCGASDRIAPDVKAKKNAHLCDSLEMTSG